MVSIRHILKDIKDARRVRQITEAFAMGGFSYYIKKIGLGRCVTIQCRINCLLKRRCDCPPGKHSLPVHFREIIEGLGPTFIKLGQLLSLRPDMIPKEYCDELRKLQDEVPGFSFNKVKQIIEREFKKPLNKIFSSFDKKPIAAASIAQVHMARLKNGKKVAVKVLRPHVSEIIQKDIRIMEHVAELLENHVKESRHFRPKRFVQEFKDWTLKEIDFRNEARIMNEMSQTCSSKLIKIPKVYSDYTTKSVFTMEFLRGVHINDNKGLKRLHCNKKKLAVNGIKIMVEQTLVHGLFHGDPHPGNILALKGNRFGFLDFGIIGRLSQRQRKKMSLYLVRLFEHDFERALHHILELAEVDDDSDIKGFKRKVLDILSACYGSLGQNSLSDALFKSVIAGVHYQVYFPSDLVLLAKAFVTIEFVGRELYPQFVLLTDAREPVERTLKKELGPAKSVSNLIKNSLDYTELIEEFPIYAARVLKLVEEGELQIKIDKSEFSGYISEIHKVNNIRVIGVIIASLIIASGIMSYLQNGRPHMLAIPMMMLYLAAGLGIWLIIYMRNNKR